MSVVIVVGAQWGDEGKGRVVDWMAHEADLVARFNGGDNAGHTVVSGDLTLKLNLVPSGILYPHVVNLIGAGVVVNPQKLVSEMDELIELGVDVSPEHLKLSAAAHIILPTHRALDGAREQSRGDEALGTTKRGIGPTYADKASRVNLRAGAMLNPEQFAEGVADGVRAHNRRLENRYGVSSLSPERAAAEYCEYAKRLKDHLVDGSVIAGEAIESGQRVICEGAQGLLLDLDHGTYPYVTSSSVIAGGALTGLGFGPRYVTRVIGVAKAYTTRVGAGPFPTELMGDIGDQIRGTGDNPWDEFGTTTGRPRRCGWLDLVILRYAARINGLDELAFVKLDVLSGLDELKIAVGYERDGVRIDHFPAEFGLAALAEWKPVYETLPGWTEDITAVRKLSDLPAEAQAYIALIEQQIGLPVTSISVGPERNQVVMP